MPKNTARRIPDGAVMQAFVPLSDELLYEHPERLPARLVPYEVGMVLEKSDQGLFFPFWTHHED